MKLNTLLEYLLREESEPAASEDAPLGKYLFAPSRNDVPDEENTKLENEIESDLISHYGGNGHIGGIEQSLKTLKQLEKDGLYTKLLSPPAGLAYRYVSGLTPEEASSMYLNGYPIEDITSTPNKPFYVSDIGVIKNPGAKSSVARGNTSVSSWTIEPSALAFSGFVSAKNESVSILLVADIGSNKFLMNPEAIISSAPGLLKKSAEIRHELEVVAIGSVNVIGASAIYIKSSPITKQEADDIRAGLPKLNLPSFPEEGKPYEAPRELFVPALKYIFGIMNKYREYIGDVNYMWLLQHDPHYLNLKHYAEKGVKVSRIEDFTGLASRYSEHLVGDALSGVIFSIENSNKTKIFTDKIQHDLLFALKKAGYEIKYTS
jgi:hypothetical protein